MIRCSYRNLSATIFHDLHTRTRASFVRMDNDGVLAAITLLDVRLGSNGSRSLIDVDR